MSGPRELGHRRRGLGGRDDLVDGGSHARLDRSEDRPLDERGFADVDAPPVLLGEVLERQLEAQRGTAEVEQHDGGVGPVEDIAYGLGDARSARAKPPVLRATRGRDRDVRARHLDDHLAKAIDELAAVGDEDQTHQARLLSISGWIAPGCWMTPMVVGDSSRRKQDAIKRCAEREAA